MILPILIKIALRIVLLVEEKSEYKIPVNNVKGILSSAHITVTHRVKQSLLHFSEYITATMR